MTVESVIQLANTAMGFHAGRGPGVLAAIKTAPSSPRLAATIQHRLSKSPANRIAKPCDGERSSKRTGKICRIAAVALRRAMRANSPRDCNSTRLKADSEATAALPHARRSAVEYSG